MINVHTYYHLIDIVTKIKIFHHHPHIKLKIQDSLKKNYFIIYNPALHQYSLSHLFAIKFKHIPAFQLIANVFFYSFAFKTNVK